MVFSSLYIRLSDEQAQGRNRKDGAESGHKYELGSEHGVTVIFLSQNGANHNHGDGNITFADHSDGISQKAGQRYVSQHKEKADKNGYNTGMLCQLVESILFIDICEQGQARSPHGKANGNLKNGGVEYAQIPI